MTEARRRDAIAVTILALLPVLFFIRVLTGARCLYLRDLSNFHYPGRKLLRDIVLRGDFPSWNPFLSAGQPLAANPQHEVFYPLTWLILLPSYTFAFHLLIVLHVVIALVAMYALLRSMRVRPAVAAIGAISYAFGGVLLSMLNLFTLLFSAAWLPLTCLFTRRYLEERRGRDLALAAFVLGLQLLIGEPVTVLQTGILVAAYAMWRARLRGVLVVAVITIAALGVGAVQILPAVDLFRDSVRSQKLTFASVSSWSLPPSRLAELLNPDLLGDPAGPLESWRGMRLYPEHVVPFYFSIYAGLLMLAATLAGLGARVRGSGLVVALLLVSIFLALGRTTPVLRILYELGVGAYLRFPEKCFLIAAFTLVVFGTRTLQALLDGDARVRRSMLATLAILAVAALVPLFTTPSRDGWLATGVRILVLALLVLALPRVRVPFRALLFGAFVLADLLPIASRLAPTLPSSYYDEAPAVVKSFPSNRDDFRIFQLSAWDVRNRDALQYILPSPERYWSYRNSLAPITPAAHGLRLVLNTDYDASSLLASDAFLRSAVALSKRVPGEWIDVVAAMSNVHYMSLFRPFAEASAEAGGDFRRIQPVRYVRTTPYPRYYFATQIVPVGGADEFVELLSSHRYDRRAAFVDRKSDIGRSVPNDVPAGRAPSAAHGTVHRVLERTNEARIDVTADGYAFLVMSVTPHKYWQVFVDRDEVQSAVTNVGYQGVVVPPGRHTVEMRYSNPLLAAGGALSVGTLLLLALIGRRGITMRAL